MIYMVNKAIVMVTVASTGDTGSVVVINCVNDGIGGGDGGSGTIDDTHSQ